MLHGICPKCGSSEVYRSQHPGGIWNEDALLLQVWTDAGPAVTEAWHTQNRPSGVAAGSIRRARAPLLEWCSLDISGQR
jgi:hypothetical protein